ncbi:MAG: hypothetical protein AAFX50_03680 [Acidobacteriota bacterium]
MVFGTITPSNRHTHPGAALDVALGFRRAQSALRLEPFRREAAARHG